MIGHMASDAEGAAQALAPGALVADRYCVQAILGQGGMGAVYRATDDHRNARPVLAEEVLFVGSHRAALRELPLRREIALKYPTATVAEIELEAERWADAEEGGGTLARFIRPRDLDPELGPED